MSKMEVAKKVYRCPVCKKMHSIEIAKDIAKERSKYPFSYVFLHKYEGEDENLRNEKHDIITVLYIDANLNIRGVDAILQEDYSNIMSKGESKQIIENLMKHITELQEAYDTLLKKYNELKQKLKEN